jgi:hypothetical protein
VTPGDLLIIFLRPFLLLLNNSKMILAGMPLLPVVPLSVLPPLISTPLFHASKILACPLHQAWLHFSNHNHNIHCINHTTLINLTRGLLIRLKWIHQHQDSKLLD